MNPDSKIAKKKNTEKITDVSGKITDIFSETREIFRDMPYFCKKNEIYLTNKIKRKTL